MRRAFLLLAVAVSVLAAAGFVARRTDSPGNIARNGHVATVDDVAGESAPRAAAAAPASRRRRRVGVPDPGPRTSDHVCFCGAHTGGGASEWLGSLEWLAVHQSRDGSWSASAFEDRCGSSPCGGAVAGVDDAETTGLALLSLLGSGETHNSGVYKVHVKRAFEFLRYRMSQDGWLATDGGDVRANAIATVALTELYGLTGSKMVKPRAERALRALFAAQQRDAWPAVRGGADRNIQATVWAAIAMKSALMAEISVPVSTMERLRRGLREFGAPAGLPRRACAGLAIARVFHEGVPPNDVPEMRAAFAQIFERPPVWNAERAARGESLDLRALHFEILVAKQYADDGEWPSWVKAVFASIRERQCNDENSGRCQSFDAWGPSSRAEGRVRRTALALLTLRGTQGYRRVFHKPR